MATNAHIMCVYADKKAVVENDFDPVILKCHDDKKDGKPGGKVKTLFTDLKRPTVVQLTFLNRGKQQLMVTWLKQ